MFFLLLILLYSTLIIKFCNCLEAVPNNKIFRRKLIGKIYGGSSIDIARYPSIVGLLANGQLVCGGTIIGWTTVLTAAHCFTKVDFPVTYTIRSKSTYADRGGIIYAIRIIMIHQKYEDVYLSYDFAVAKTIKAFDYNQIAPLARKAIPPGSTVQVAGWGMSEENKLMNNLQYGNLTMISNKHCKRWLKEFSIGKTVLCAVSVGGKVDTCSGDSGGPLYYGSRVAGVTSWGVSCGDEYPGVYGNVSFIAKWLDQFLRV